MVCFAGGRLALMVVGSLVAVAVSPGLARDLSFAEAMRMAVGQTSRGAIIAGDLEVAEKRYFAERITFYVPKVSINSSLPSYSSEQSFRLWGQPTKETVKTSDFDFTSNIQLKQSLFTGGELTARANLLSNESSYPLWGNPGMRIDESTLRGFFDFELTQPVLKPSENRHALNNSRDNYRLAELTRVEEQSALRREIAEAYFGVLQTDLRTEIAQAKLRSARLQSEIDSVKHVDEVVSEETWLMSASARIDAELALVEIENEAAEKNRELASLLDLDVTDEIAPQVPFPERFAEGEKAAYLQEWRESIPIRRASLEWEKARRNADYQSSSLGINGDLRASYSMGRGRVESDASADDDQIKTSSWGISLNVTFPVFDGGASGATVRAAEIEADKKRLEYERAEKSARAEIVNLVSRVEVGYRKLEVVRKQIDLSRERLDISEYRFNDGQISEIEYLAARVAFLEARDKYLEELKQYLLDRIALAGKYSV
jgi:outer membrane protein TolC